MKVVICFAALMALCYSLPMSIDLQKKMLDVIELEQIKRIMVAEDHTPNGDKKVMGSMNDDGEEENGIDNGNVNTGGEAASGNRNGNKDDEAEKGKDGGESDIGEVENGTDNENTNAGGEYSKSNSDTDKTAKQSMKWPSISEEDSAELKDDLLKILSGYKKSNADTDKTSRESQKHDSSMKFPLTSKDRREMKEDLIRILSE